MTALRAGHQAKQVLPGSDQQSAVGHAVHGAALLRVADALAAFDPRELFAGKAKQSMLGKNEHAVFRPLHPSNRAGVLLRADRDKSIAIEAKQAMAAADQDGTLCRHPHAVRSVANLVELAAPQAKQTTLGGEQKRVVARRKEAEDLARLARVGDAEKPVAVAAEDAGLRADEQGSVTRLVEERNLAGLLVRADTNDAVAIEPIKREPAAEQQRAVIGEIGKEYVGIHAFFDRDEIVAVSAKKVDSAKCLAPPDQGRLGPDVQRAVARASRTMGPGASGAACAPGPSFETLVIAVR